jgi:hypothetical protein
MEYVILGVYVVLGYWACGKTIYANKIRIGTANNLFLTRLILGILLGFILIPVAIIKTIFFR